MTTLKIVKIGNQYAVRAYWFGFIPGGWKDKDGIYTWSSHLRWCMHDNICDAIKTLDLWKRSYKPLKDNEVENARIRCNKGTGL